MPKTLYILLLVIFFPVGGQSPNDPLPTGSFLNIPLLEHLTKIKIDSVRNRNRLPPLYNDSILYIAAQDHAGYLFHKELSHFQPADEHKKTPQKRAEHYGAVNYLIGENIARTTLNAKITHRLKNTKNKTLTFQVGTYERAAYSLAVSWVNSPPHYANIINPSYDVTGLAISVDDRGVVTAVQKFAKVLYRYEFSNQAQPFPYAEYIAPYQGKNPGSFSQVPVRTDYPWKLKPGRAKDSQRVKDFFIDMPLKDHFQKQKDNYVFTTPNIGGIKKIIRKRRDGFAVELVPYEPFDCGNPDYYWLPSRRNNRYIFNGSVLKPVYKKTFLQQYKAQLKANKRKKKQDLKATKRKQYTSKEEKGYAIDEIKKRSIEPDNIECIVGTHIKGVVSGRYEANLIILQKRKVAYVMHFSNVCGSHDLITKPVPLYPKFYKVNIPTIYAVRKTNITVPFERNAFTLSEDEMLRLRSSIPNDSLIGIRIAAWASVEGLENINVDLQQKRVATMQAIIEPLVTAKHLKSDIQSGENWELFYSQLATTSYTSYKDTSKARIKKWLERPEILSEFESKLDAQRIARLEVSTMQETDVLSSPDIAYEYLRKLLELLEEEDEKLYSMENVKAATTIQKYLYEQYLLGKISKEKILRLDIPDKYRFIPIRMNQLWFEHQYVYRQGKASEIPPNFLGSLKWCTKKNDNLALYNAAAFMVNSWKARPIPGSLPVDDLERMIYRIQPSSDTLLFTKPQLDSLKLNFNIKKVKYYAKSDPKELVDPLDFIFSFHSSMNLNDSSCYALARYFNTFEADRLTAMTLLKRVWAEKPDPNILAMYLKLLYVHKEETNDYSYYSLLQDAYQKMTPEEWCGMFNPPCNISFQVLDHEEFRNFYCEKCKK